MRAYGENEGDIHTAMCKTTRVAQWEEYGISK
jgi:hypothetical protein